MAKSRGPSAVDIGAAVGVVGEVINALKAIPNTVAGFVAAFNPAAVLGMDQAFRDLSATVGAGLEPVVQGVTQVVKLVGDEFAATFDALRPVVADVTGQLLNVLQPVIRVLSVTFANVVDTVKSFMPVVTLVTTVLEGLAATFLVVANVAEAVMAAVYEAVGAYLNLSEVTGTVRDAFVYLLGTLVKFADGVLRFLGFADVADKVLQNLARDSTGQGKKAAPRDVGLSGLEDVYRKRIVEAAKAGQGADPVQKQTSIMEELQKLAREQLEQGKANNAAALEQFKELMRNVQAIATGVGATVDAVKGLGRNAYNVGGAAGTAAKKVLGMGLLG